MIHSRAVSDFLSLFFVDSLTIGTQTTATTVNKSAVPLKD